MANPADLALKNLEKLIAKDPLLRDIVNPSLPEAKRQARYSPDVDVLETAEGWQILLDMPGVPRDSLTVDLDGTRLIIKGTKPTRRVEGASVRVSERPSGPFKREFLLPFQVQAQGIRARLSDGVLVVDIPRHGKSTKRSVTID